MKSVLASCVKRSVVRQRAHRVIVVNLSQDVQLGRQLVPNAKTYNPLAVRAPWKVVARFEFEIQGPD